jgi:diketogulonate reductase-like aldo/keto reductase
MSEGLAKIAAEQGIESITAIALAYVMSKAANVFPIIGGKKVEQLKDNIQALSIKLTQKQIEYLESIKPFDIGFPHDWIPADPNITGESFLIARSNAMKFPNARRLTSL